MTGPVAISLLGPVTIEVGGVAVPITARRQRAVLAWLALQAGRPVSADQLLDAVWGDGVPVTGVRAVAFQVSKLRSLLEPGRDGEGTLIATSPAGYRLGVERDDVDIHRFDRLVTEARAALAADPARSRALIDEAIALWRGRPFADLGDEPFVNEETRHLDQRRALAERTALEADIALGRYAAAVPELERLVDDDPLDESAVQMLMLALAGSGRVAAALRTYGAFRVRLGHELGIEPSRDTQALEQRLLDQEPAPNSATEVGHRATATPGRGPAHGGIPASRSPLIGRADEIAGVEQLMSSARLVTLSGFGGLGKTRLAQEIAIRSIDRYEHGVWFVDLTQVADRSLLADAFIAAGGVPTAATQDPIERLTAHLAGRDVLLVVDNCEHLVDEVALLIDTILERAPRVRALATSRVPIGVSDEAVWIVRPLSGRSSVELLIERARLVRPTFVLDEGNRADIDRLCERLDGIPLAIEMAAGRLIALSSGDLADLLDDRFGALSHSRRNIHEKHRSMAAIMEWSYQVLTEPQREMLRRLSVCAGGFTLEAARLIGLPDAVESTALAALEVLTPLVEASVVAFDDVDDEPRYSMLETVREYAADQLTPEERGDAEQAHAAYYASVAAQVRALYGQDRDAMLRLGDRELGNLHAAIARSYAGGDPDHGLSIARNMWPYFASRRLFQSMRYVRVGVELIGNDAPAVLEATALALILESGTGRVGDPTVADAEFRRYAAERLENGLRNTDDPQLRSTMLRGLAADAWITDPRAADSYLSSAAATADLPPEIVLMALGNQVETGWAIGGLPDEAMVRRRLAEIAASSPALSMAVANLEPRLDALAGRWHDVLRVTQSAVPVDQSNEFHMRLASATALIAVGRHDEALVELERLPPESDETRLYRPFLQASAALALGEPDRAVTALAPLTNALRTDARRLSFAASVTSLLAVAAHDFGQLETAAVLFGHAAAELDRLQISIRAVERPAVELARDRCRAALGGERFEALAARGALAVFDDLPDVPARQ